MHEELLVLNPVSSLLESFSLQLCVWEDDLLGMNVATDVLISLNLNRASGTLH